MKCPHCLIDFHDTWSTQSIGEDDEGIWRIQHTTCPKCKRYIISLLLKKSRGGNIYDPTVTRMVHPKGTARTPSSPEVPPKFAEAYKEACLVFDDSAKASAALSRRCLQLLLREVANVTPSDLFHEIQEVLDSGKLPTHLTEAIDSIRAVGNFAVHPLKSTNTGEVIDVEPGEAEWLLDTLEGLFDFYFVQPAILKAKRDALNKKLTVAGKPGIK